MQRLRNEIGLGHETLRAFDGDLRFLQSLFAHPYKVIGAGEIFGGVFGTRLVVVVAGGCGGFRRNRASVGVTQLHANDTLGN